MIKAAILTGEGENADIARLVQLLHDHPDVELMAYADPGHDDERLDELYPALTGETDLHVSHKIDLSKIDVVFIAADADTARNFMTFAELPDDIYVIDMSGQYRLPDEDNKFIQGIPELNRKAMVRGAHYVSMPDPTTTAIALSLLPLAKNLLLNNHIHAHVVSHDAEAESNSLTARIIDHTVIDQLTHALSSLQNSFSAPISGVEFTGDTTEGLIAVTTIETPVELDEIKSLYTEF